jgi:glutamate 5-kinase
VSGNRAAFDRRAAFSPVRTVVVKVGTNVLTTDTGEMALERIQRLVDDIAALRDRQLRVILVTSGAISMGMDRLGFKARPTELRDKQACAAVGQVRLMSVYEQTFLRHGITTAQILLTEDDFSSRVRYLNLRNTISRLLEHRVVPVINENDTVSTSEIETDAGGADGGRKPIFGDNDRLSALVTSKLDADLLVILSDVDGLYELAPGATPGGEGSRLVSVVEAITPEIEAMAQGGNPRGRGGMAAKLQSIRVALESGGLAVIASGLEAGILPRILAGEDLGTVFLPGKRIASRKRWIAYATATSGRIVINAGARDALLNRRSSLLFAGVVAVEGSFQRGDVVAIVDESRREVARGIANLSAHDALPLLGKRSAEIASLAGKDYAELIHRDNIAVLESLVAPRSLSQ